MATIDVGYWIAATLKKDTAPLRCFVGQVAAVDERGIRVTLTEVGGDMPNEGDFYGYDVFIPWSNLESALIATPEYRFRDRFHLDANSWQEKMVR